MGWDGTEREVNRSEMQAHAHLCALYESWRELTQQEAEAIRTAFWSKVTKCQHEKHKLQKDIVSATEALQIEVAAQGLSQARVDEEMRTIVDELIILESRNDGLLANQRERARREEAALERSSRNLRRVHRAYSGRPSTAWQSYS